MRPPRMTSPRRRTAWRRSALLLLLLLLRVTPTPPPPPLRRRRRRAPARARGGRQREAALTKSTFELRSGELLASVEGAKLRGSRAANGGALVLLRFTTNSGRVGGVLPAPAVV